MGGKQAHENTLNITYHQRNENHNVIESLTIRTGQLLTNKQKLTLWKDMFVRKFKPHELLVEMLNGAASLENSVAIPQIIKHRINI